MVHHRLVLPVVVCALAFSSCPSSLPGADAAFVRGSARGTGEIDISDAIFIIGYLFLGGETPPCLDAGDANDDGKLDLSDGIYDLNFLFVGGAAPPEPFPGCGVDPTEDELGCEGFRGCICDGIAGFPCPSDKFFCEHPAGTCDVVDNLGTCVPVPDACPRIFDPVCGCDGVTYSNDCERRRARAQKAHDGPCEKEVCGGIIGAPCPDGTFCEHPEGTCDVADNQGACVPIPELCPENFDPVCGCDGVTYSNDCERQRAKAQKAHHGPCAEVCGGIIGAPCPKGMFCEHPAGTCDIVDNQGTCVPIPDACLAVFDPVCGCDGKTYSNDCVRRAAQVQKAHDGACLEER